MMKLSRRQVLLAGSAALAAPLVSRGASARSLLRLRRLPLPPLVEPKNGGTVALTMAMARHAFDTGRSALSAGINADYLGPVVRLKNGMDVNFNVQNRLGDVTTLHWHGLFVPSRQDGGPHNLIKNGEDWNIKVHVNQSSSTNWFHPHVHQNTAYQAHLGLAGLMIVDDGNDRARGLPCTYGADDLPLVLQDRRVIDGDRIYEPDAMDLLHGFHGDRLIVNGVINPSADVPRGIVRLRLLNGANARIFNLAFSDRRPFHVIASDGGYLAKPVEVAKLQFGPGERYEVLVDFSKGDSTVALHTTAQDDGGGENMALMRFSVRDGLKAEVKALPRTLDGPGAADTARAVQKRSFFMDERMRENMRAMMAHNKHGGHDMMSMEGGHSMMHGSKTAAQAGKAMTAATSGFSMAIAGKTFDMNRIDVRAGKGSHELWTLSTSGDMMHPFHIHGASFRVLSQDGKTPPAWQNGWKDTVLVNRQAEILVHFNRDADEKAPFMFHCHTLEHEDLGMMGQFITV